MASILRLLPNFILFPSFPRCVREPWNDKDVAYACGLDLWRPGLLRKDDSFGFGNFSCRGLIYPSNCEHQRQLTGETYAYEISTSCGKPSSFDCIPLQRVQELRARSCASPEREPGWNGCFCAAADQFCESKCCSFGNSGYSSGWSACDDGSGGASSAAHCSSSSATSSSGESDGVGGRCSDCASDSAIKRQQKQRRGWI